MPRRLFLVATTLMGLVATACGSDGGGGLQAVRDDGQSMFFQLPADWTVLQEADLAGVAETPFVSQDIIDLPIVSRVVFEGGVAGSGVVIDPAATTVPVGSAVVRSISSGNRDYISRFLLAELVFPYHQQSSAQILTKDDLSLGDGFDGVQVVVRYTDAGTNEQAVVSLVSVTDPEVTKMYSIAVGCTIDCFIDHQQTITDVIDSWLVNTR